jgi:hypothetical protein
MLVTMPHAANAKRVDMRYRGAHNRENASSLRRRALFSARLLEGRQQVRSCPRRSFETLTRSKLRVTSSG